MRGILPAVGALLAPAAFADELSDAHKRLLGRGDLQFEFTPPPQVVHTPPPSDNWLARFLDTLAPVFNVIFWGALAAAVIALAYFIGREAWLARRGRDNRIQTRTETQETNYRPEASRARALLEDADRLAAEGRYDEAVHTLLHRSIEDIEKRAPRAIRPAQTSREIARLDVLPGSVRNAFAPLVRAVERSWFGGLPVDRDVYAVCRDSYVQFALPEAWS